MSLIKPRTRGKQMVRLVTRLDRENHDTLHAYAQFLGEPTEYVLNEMIDTVLAKDKDFVKWRADHPDSGAPRPSVMKADHRSEGPAPDTREPASTLAVTRPATAVPGRS
ncbi:MAG TPA: hypothetical protein VGK32_12540 [Vicinamibacterales bacterium]|jgi:hypothetical protein